MSPCSSLPLVSKTESLTWKRVQHHHPNLNFGLNEFALLKVSLCFNRNGHWTSRGGSHFFGMVLGRVTIFLPKVYDRSLMK